VSTDEQVAELAAKLRAVPRKYSVRPPGHVPDFDALARVAIDHCAAQPAAGGLSDEELAAELRKMRWAWNSEDPDCLAIARRARHLCPAPPHEPPMPSEEELEAKLAKAWLAGAWPDVARAAARALHRTLAPETSDPECLGAGHCMEHEVLSTPHHPNCPRFDKVRQPDADERLRAERDDARILAASRFAEISTLRAELSDARGRLADVIQAASTPGGGA
jgi:hypothetical protein